MVLDLVPDGSGHKGLAPRESVGTVIGTGVVLNRIRPKLGIKTQTSRYG